MIRPGENLYRLSLYYGVEVDQIRRANRVGDETELRVGQTLRIPGASRPQPAYALTPGPAVGRPGGAGPPADAGQALREANLRFGWPLSGRVSSRFGWRSGRRHEGIDIPAKGGTRIHAAESGKVIYSGRLRDYGNVVIVKHAGRYSTVYAHNSENRARKGQFVERGDVIATVGRSGNASGAHLHFELRRDRVAQDPLRFLLDPAQLAGADGG